MTPAPPATPNTPLTPPLAAPQSTVHSREDLAYNRIAAAMTASMNAAAEVPPVIPVVVPPVMPVPDAPPTDVAAAAEVVPVQEPNSVDPADVDFDAPPVETQTDQPKPLIPDSQLAKTMEEKLATGAPPEEIKELFLKTSQGKRMLASFHTMRELEKAPEEGGMGRLPSIEEIREGDSARRQVTAMQFEYAENPASFVHNLFVFDPATGINAMGANPQHAIKVLETIPQALSRAMQETQSPVYSQLMAAYSAPVFNGFLNTQYREALAMPTENQQQIQAATSPEQVPLANAKARRLDALQMIESTVFGQARPLNLGQPVQPAAGESQVEADLRRQLTQANSRIQQGESARVTGIRSSIENSAKTSAMTDIDTLLKQTGVTNIHPEAILGPHKNEIYREVHAALAQFDPTGWQNYEIMLGRVANGNGDQAATTKQYQQLFRNALRHSPDVKARVGNLVSSAKAASDAQHTARAQAALRSEPNGGVAVPQTVLAAAQLERQPGESREDHMTRKFSASMTNGRPANPGR